MEQRIDVLHINIYGIWSEILDEVIDNSSKFDHMLYSPPSNLNLMTLKEIAKSVKVGLVDPSFYYSVEPGYLTLDAHAWHQYNLTEEVISIRSSSHCFSTNPFVVVFIEAFVGYDTIILSK